MRVLIALLAAAVLNAAPADDWPQFRGNPRLTGVATSTLPKTLKVGSSRVDLQACKLEYSIVSPK